MYIPPFVKIFWFHSKTLRPLWTKTHECCKANSDGGPATVYLHPLEVWDAEENLHHCAKVASVAQVFDARVTRAKHSLQLHPRLLDHLPLADPQPGVIVCVVTILCLKGWRELGVKHLKVEAPTWGFYLRRPRRVTFFCICSMSIPKWDKCSDMWGSNTASSSSNE